VLVSLSLKNFGLFKDENIEFSDGLNIISGESGAGKSMFISAINSLITGQFPSELKNQDGMISAFFNLNDTVKKIITQTTGIESNEAVVSANFSSKKTLYRINGMIVTKNIIEEIGKYLIEIHSQESSAILRDPLYQNKLMYDIIINKYSEAFAEYNSLYSEYSMLKEKAAAIPSDPSEVLRKIDMLNFQINEIKKTDPQPNEDTELSERFRALNNIQEIKKNLYENMQLLKDSEEFNTDNSIGTVAYNLSKIREYGFKDAEQLAISIQQQLLELYDAIEKKLLDLQTDPQELNNVSERLNAVLMLKRKYGPSLDDVITNCKKFEEELNRLYELESIMNELTPRMEKIKKHLFEVSERIINESMPYLKQIKQGIEKNLADLNMQNAEIDFYFEKLKEPGQISAHRIRILMKTNPQSDFLPLDKIASGGEMSRIFLAIETVFGTDHSVDSMLYDEVDAGVGPRMAMTVGEKLKELSKDKQLIVITHMPQVANLAEKHLKITKVQNTDLVYSTVTELTGEQREKEIKDMYGEIIV